MDGGNRRFQCEPDWMNNWPDDQTTNIFRSLMRAHRDLRSLASEVAIEFGLSAAELNIVDMLGWLGPTTMGQLARAAFVSPSNTTHTVKRLESAGLVSRSRSKESQRIVEVMLTEDGSELFKTCYPRVVNVVDGYLRERYSEHELKDLEMMLARLT